jgi:hypothetical protein
MERLVGRYSRMLSPMEQLMVVMARVVATCPTDPAAAADVLNSYLDVVRNRPDEALDRHALVLLALVDLYGGDEGSARQSLAVCDGPYEILTPLVWEYRQRVEGWPSDELHQRRSASMTSYLSEVPAGEARIRERTNALLERPR